MAVAVALQDEDMEWLQANTEFTKGGMLGTCSIKDLSKGNASS